MRRAIALLIAGTLVLLFAVLFRTSSSHDDEVASVEDDIGIEVCLFQSFLIFSI